jgi:hypothetical protein
MVNRLNKLTICFACLIIFILSTGCEAKNSLQDVDRIIFTVDSGPILPELQAHEVYTITPSNITLKRTGVYSNTEVFEGEWAFSGDEALLQELFTIAKRKDCSAYMRVEPEDAPDGGHTIRLTVVYADESECTLIYDPGVTYKGADELFGKLKEVLNNLKSHPSMAPK